MGQIGIAQLKSMSSKINQQHEWTSSREYQAFFTLDCDETYVRNNTVIQSGAAPIAINDEHPTDNKLVISDIVPSTGEQMAYFDETGTYASSDNAACIRWNVSIEYGPYDIFNMSLSGNMIDVPMNYYFEPDNQPKIIYTTADLDEDGNPKPLLNSSFEYYDPAVDREVAQRKLHVLRNEIVTAADWVTISSWENCINKATFLGYAPHTVRLIPMKTPKKIYCQNTGQYYTPMDYCFDIRLETHDKIILDQGYKQLTTTTDGEGDTITIQEDIVVDGVPATSPVLLNGSGQPLTLPPSDDNPIVTQTRQVYPELDFSVFNMDNLFTLGGVGG